jgi:hypothetical protein
MLTCLARADTTLGKTIGGKWLANRHKIKARKTILVSTKMRNKQASEREKKNKWLIM